MFFSGPRLQSERCFFICFSSKGTPGHTCFPPPPPPPPLSSLCQLFLPELTFVSSFLRAHLWMLSAGVGVMGGGGGGGVLCVSGRHAAVFALCLKDGPRAILYTSRILNVRSSQGNPTLTSLSLSLSLALSLSLSPPSLGCNHIITALSSFPGRPHLCHISCWDGGCRRIQRRGLFIYWHGNSWPLPLPRSNLIDEIKKNVLVPHTHASMHACTHTHTHTCY